MSKNICSKDLIIDAENSIIDLEGMQEQIKELEEYMNNQTYLAMHKHDIWQGSRGYYYTYLPDPVKGRILLKKKSKNDLTKAIVEYYKCHKSVNILFNEWLEHKLAYRLIKEPSAIRYEADYKRFIYGTDFGDTEVANVTEEMLEEFIISSIFDNELTAKAFSGLRTIIMGMFRYAKKKKYTALSITNFFGDLELSPNMFKHVAKNDEDEVFTDAEVKRISDYVKENPTIWNLAVLLAFHTGLRVGELTSLTSGDIDWQRHILLINKTEIKIKDEKTGKYTYVVSDHGKTDNSTRTVIFTDSTEWVLKAILQINPYGTYLFENENGKRIRGTTINKRLYGICKALNIKQRSIHKSRKSYATQLLDAGISDALIISQIGHSNIVTTKKHYYRNNHTLDDSKKKLECALVLG